MSTCCLAGLATDELTDFDRANSAVTHHDGLTWDMLYDDLGAAAGADPYSRWRGNVTDFSAFSVASDKEFAGFVEGDIVTFLQGAYVNGTGLQTDELRVKNLIPTDPSPEPYTALGYSFAGFGGGETVQAANLNQVDDEK